MLIIKTLVFVLIVVTCTADLVNLEVNLTSFSRKRQTKLAEEEGNTFETAADIAIERGNLNSLLYLEAFKSSSNNRILDERKDINRMKWFSIGYPSLMVNKTNHAIMFDSTGFFY